MNSLAVSRSLQSAGIAREHADAIAEAMTDRDLNAATKADLDAVNTNLQRDIAAIRSELSKEIAAVRTDLTKDIAAVRTDLTKEIAAVRTDLSKDIAISAERLRTEMHAGNNKILMAIAAAAIGLFISNTIKSTTAPGHDRPPATQSPQP